MNLYDMKLSTKLIGAFLVISVISAIGSGIGLHDMSKLNTNADKTYRLDLVGLKLIQQANADVLRTGTYLRNAILASNTEQRAASLDAAAQALASARSRLNDAEPLIYTEKGKSTFSDLDQNWQDFAQAFVQMKSRIAKADLKDRDSLSDYLLHEYHDRGYKTLVLMSALTALKQSDAQNAAESNESAYDQSRNLMLVFVFLSVMIGLGLGVTFTRSLTRQLGTEPAKAADLARSVAAGDLSVSIDLRADDTNSLMASLKEMRDALSKVVSNVRVNAESVATASAQIAQGNLDLSSRTEEQAASLEETASSMEQLTATVRQNADNSKQAAKLAGAASDVANQGGEIVGQVVNTMHEISASSTKMSEIITVIEDIAFQTNILALNAAVEAARAGEQGRGFAVVAGEVRTLAQRSAASARQIKELIAASANHVETGSVLVGKAGGAIKEIVASVKRVTDIVDEISSASVEQSIGIEQVNQAVSQMDEVTQQNAALVEEASAAAKSMAEQAQSLREAVAFFKVSSGRETMSSANLPPKAFSQTPLTMHAAH